MSNNDEAPRCAAVEGLESLLEQQVKAIVAPGVYTRLLELADAVARTSYGRGYTDAANTPLTY